MSPGGSSKEGRQPGTLQGDRLTPSVPATHTATRFMRGKHPRISQKEQKQQTHRSPSAPRSPWIQSGPTGGLLLPRLLPADRKCEQKPSVQQCLLRPVRVNQSEKTGYTGAGLKETGTKMQWSGEG